MPSKKLETLWSTDISATNDLIKAGDCLYAADSSGIKAIKLRRKNETKLIWSYKTDKNVERLLAANGKLIAVTGDGTIMVFGDSKPAIGDETRKNNHKLRWSKTERHKKLLMKQVLKMDTAWFLEVRILIKLKDLLATTALNIVVYEKDAARVNFLREYFDKAGITANRISFQHYKNTFPLLPKYFSSLTVINDLHYLNGRDKRCSCTNV